MLWNDDIAYAMTPFKLLSLPLGSWPLQKYNKFSLMRYIVSNCSLVRVSVLFCKYTVLHNFSYRDIYLSHTAD